MLAQEQYNNERRRRSVPNICWQNHEHANMQALSIGIISVAKWIKLSELWAGKRRDISQQQMRVIERGWSRDHCLPPRPVPLRRDGFYNSSVRCSFTKLRILSPSSQWLVFAQLGFYPRLARESQSARLLRTSLHRTVALELSPMITVTNWRMTMLWDCYEV